MFEGCLAVYPRDIRVEAGVRLQVTTSPYLDWQPRDFREVVIARYHGQAVLRGDRGNPDIVFRDGPAFNPQIILDPSVVPSGGSIAPEDCHRCGELVNAVDVCLGTRRLSSPVVEFSECNGRHEYPVNSGHALQDGWFRSEDRDDYVCVEKEPTIHPY